MTDVRHESECAWKVTNGAKDLACRCCHFRS